MEMTCTCSHAGGGHAINCPFYSAVGTFNITAAATPYQQVTTGWISKPVYSRIHPDDIDTIVKRVIAELRAKVL